MVIGILLAFSFVTLVFTGWNYYQNNQATQATSLMGKLVQVDDKHKLHIYCTGQGSPTVILESSVLEWSIHWQAVQPGIARFTRVCSYDRAGYGWSDPGPKPRSAEEIVKELHTLLANAGEKGPYVLVGHSYWGPATLLFQHDYPGEVKGMVLVDSWTPDMFSPTPDVIIQSQSLANSLGRIAPLGLVRLFYRMHTLPVDQMLQANLVPPQYQQALLSAAFKSDLWNTLSDEYSATPDSARQLNGLGKLGDLPLAVIKAGKRLAASYPSQAVWDQKQKELEGLSTKSQLIIAENSGTSIPLEQPDLVVKTVEDIVQLARNR